MVSSGSGWWSLSIITALPASTMGNTESSNEPSLTLPSPCLPRSLSQWAYSRLANRYFALGKVGTQRPSTSWVFQPTWSTCRWVHITRSTDSGAQPQAFSRLRKGVSRLRQPGLVRCLWLPRQVSIRMVCRGVLTIQVWIEPTRRSEPGSTWSGSIHAFWASKACWLKLGNMRAGLKPAPQISSTFSMVAPPSLRTVMAASFLERDDAADRLALVHQVEGVVDLLDRHGVGDQRIDVDLAVHVPVDDLGHVAPSLGAAERRAQPVPASHELEGPRGDLLTGAGDADDHRFAPAAMTAFQRLAHQLGVADTFEAVVGAAVGEFDQVRHQVLALERRRIDEVSHAELAAERLARRVEVDAHDHVGADHARALQDVEPDAAQAEHDDVGARFDLGGVEHRADAGGDAAADVADLVERRDGADFRQRNLGQHGVVREGRAAHIVVDLLALERKARRAVGHHALTLGRADRGAEIGLAGEAGFAGAAFGRVERDHVIALLQRDDAGPDVDHHARTLMAEDHRKEPFGIAAGTRELVGVADARCLDLDQHLAELRPFE